MADEFKGINQQTLKNVEAIKSSMVEIATASAKANQQLTQQTRLLADYKKSYSDIASSAGKFAKLQDEASRSASATGKALKEQQIQLSNIRSLNAQIENLMDQQVSATDEQNKALKRQINNLTAARDNARELADAYGELVDDSSKLDRSTMWFSALSEVVKDVPGLRKLSGPFEAAAKAARETVLSNAKIKSTNETIASLGKDALKNGKGLTAEKLKQLGLEEVTQGKSGPAAAKLLKTYQASAKTQSASIAGMQAGFKALGPVISSAFGPLAIITTIVDLVKGWISAQFYADKQVTDIAKKYQITKDSARAIYGSLVDQAKKVDDIRVGYKQIIEANFQIADLTEFTVIATKEQLQAQVELTKLLGVQVEDALKLQELYSINNIEADKGTEIIYDQIAAFANENKLLISGNKLMSDIAKTSNLIKLNFKGGLNELVKTTLEAKKLGLSLDQVSKTADALLNFEQSISSELEAELLTGRNINLEKARQAALNNDIAGLTEAIAEQGYDAAGFAKLNRIQQEAIAKTLGMSASELADSLYKQEIINKEAGDYTKRLREQGIALGDISMQKRADAIEQGILDGKSLEMAEKQFDAQTRFNESIERVKEIFTGLVEGGAIDTLAKYFERIAFTLSKGGSLWDIIRGNVATEGQVAASKASDLKKEAAGTTGAEQQDLLKRATEQSQIAFNERYKQAKEAFEGNPLSFIDYENTPAYKKWVAKAAAEGLEMPKLAAGGIVSSPTTALIGESGPEAVIPLNELYAKFDELIAVAKSGGNIYIDSTKVGTALGLATFNSNVNFNS